MLISNFKTNLQISAGARIDWTSVIFVFIGSSPEYTELSSVVRLLLILSHGNMAVESGLSVNSDFIVENLQEDSLMAQRTVYDTVKACGGHGCSGYQSHYQSHVAVCMLV